MTGDGNVLQGCRYCNLTECMVQRMAFGTVALFGSLAYTGRFIVINQIIMVVFGERFSLDPNV